MSEERLEQEEAVEQFLTDVTSAAWGSVSKSELEFFIFALLVGKRRVDLSKTDAEISTQLQITPVKVRSLRYRYDQRTMRELSVEQLLAAIIPHRVAADSTLIIQVENDYIRDHLIDRMHAHNALVQKQRTRGLLKVDVVQLFVMLNALGAFAVPEGMSLQEDLERAYKDTKGAKRRESLAAVLAKAGAISGVLNFAKNLSTLL